MNTCVKIHNPFLRIQIERATFLCYCFIFSCVFLPRDTYNLKLIFFVLFILSSPKSIRLTGLNRNEFFAFCASILFTLYLTLISFATTGNLIFSFKECYYWLFLFALFPIINIDINLEKIVIIALKSLMLLMLLSFLFDLLNIIDIYRNPFLNLFYNEFAVVAKDSGYSMYFKVHHKVNPLFLILALNSLKEKKYCWWILCGIVFLISYSDAGIFAYLFSSIMYLFDKKVKMEMKWLTIFSVIAICIAATAILPYLINEIKRQDLIEVSIQMFKENPIKILLGVGNEREIFLPRTGKIDTAMEISYVESVRRFGILGTIPMLCIILYPMIKMHNKDDKWCFFAMAGYLINASVNLFLFSSTAMVMYITAYSVYCKWSVNNRKCFT